jgi:hypothetical protein
VNDTIIETPVMELQAQAPRAGHLVAIEGGRQVSAPERMLELAIAKGMDMDQLQQLLAVKERFDEKEAEKAFTEAMTRFKENAPTIVKDKFVGYENKDGTKTGYWHATLASVCDAAIKGLAAVGISHKWVPKQSPGVIGASCVLTHRLGHSESVYFESPADTSGKKNAIQALASTLTYCQRYTLLAITGLAAHEQDDDGAQHKDPLPDWIDEHLDNVRDAKTAEELQVFWQAAAASCRRKGDAGVAPYHEIKAEVEELLRAFQSAAAESLKAKQ